MAAWIARASAGLECAAIQARTRSTVTRLGDRPRRSRTTKDGLRAPPAPSTDTLVCVTARNASTSFRKVGPMGSSPMKASTRSAVLSRSERPCASEATRLSSPSAVLPKRRALMP